MYGINLVEQYLYSLPEYRLEFQRKNYIEVYSYNGLLATRKVIEFDGNTVLCRVCGDKASGFHYGVHACEGCKGFFRRSIQQKIQYRPCLKNQMCNIMRVNRNRCQYCRLRKCIAVGMSRDAVRFGRVPKREKAKILEQMQKVNAQMQGNLLNDALGEPSEVVDQVVAAHLQYCDFTRSKFSKLFEEAWKNPKFIDCPAHMACPLSPAPEHMEGLHKWDEFSNCFTPVIRNVVNFAKSIPGFVVFCQEDQVTLLKAGTFEVLLIHLACLFDNKTNTMMFTNGCFYRKLPQQGNTSAGFLLDSMFDFADRLNQLQLTDNEVALFSALVITSPDRPRLRHSEQVQRVNSVLSCALQKLMKCNHGDEPAIFTKLLMMIPDLRTLNTLHSEKLLGLTVPQNESSQTISDGDPVLLPSASPVNELAAQLKPELCPVQSSSPRDYPDLLSHPEERTVSQYQLPAVPTSGKPAVRPGGIPAKDLSSSQQPVIGHQLPVMSREKELVLQTPFGTFHRQLMSSVQPSMSAALNLSPGLQSSGTDGPSSATMLTRVEEKDAGSKPADRCPVSHLDPTPINPPDDFIDTDIHHYKSTSQRSLPKMDVRRLVIDPTLPEAYRKRLLDGTDHGLPDGHRKRPLENSECEVDPKLAKLWEYDMRSSRSNSLSSSSSMESTDSAYRTISNPGTPRSHYEMVRSPYSNTTDVPPRVGTLSKVTEERPSDPGHTIRDRDGEENRPGARLPTLRQILLSGPGGELQGGASKLIQSDSGSLSMEETDHSPDKHYFLHKKFKLKQILSNSNSESGQSRGRASSFSTVVGQMRPRLAPVFIKPRSVEAPPRLTSRSPLPVMREGATTAQQEPDQDGLGQVSASSQSDEGRHQMQSESHPSAFTGIMLKVKENTHAEENRLDLVSGVSETSTQGLKDLSQSTTWPASSAPLAVACSDRPQNIADQSVSKSFEQNASSSTAMTWSKGNTTAVGFSLSKPSCSKPSERHPELLSRLTSAPKVNGLLSSPPGMSPAASMRSESRDFNKTPPPQLYPVPESIQRGSTYSERSPPSLLPINHGIMQQAAALTQPSQSSPDTSQNHLTAISSLKDKLLKRIDSQENLHLLPQQMAWSDTTPPSARRSQGTTAEYCPAPVARHSPPKGPLPNRSNISGHDGLMRRPSPPLTTDTRGQPAIPRYPAPNNTMPIPFPPSSVNFFPGASIPANVHPVLLFNPAAHFQALQHLQAQAHIHQQMVHMSSLAARKVIEQKLANGEGMTSSTERSDSSHQTDYRGSGTGPHSHSALINKEMEPINLTKDQLDVPQSSNNIKSEPM